MRMIITMNKRYSKAILIPNLEDRYEYLKIGGSVGHATFGGHRYLNQTLYKSEEWKSTRREVIIRDNGCDLAHPDYPIQGLILIHHIEPITIEDILERKPCVFDLDNLICTSLNTHNAIHYGDSNLLPKIFVERTKNDTCPWR